MSSIGGQGADQELARVRDACLRLPEVSERQSHGSPSFFIRDRQLFVTFVDDHHGDGNLGIWCAAPEGVQAELLETDPARFFRPPYVGHRGWLGVRLRGVSTQELRVICREAFTTVAPPTVLRMLSPA